MKVYTSLIACGKPFYRYGKKIVCHDSECIKKNGGRVVDVDELHLIDGRCCREYNQGANHKTSMKER